MFEYVENSQYVKEARRFSSSLLCDLRKKLFDKNMNVEFTLVGSAKRKLITRNGNGPIDFDYNLKILSCDDFNNCKQIKEKVMKCFNSVLNENNLSAASDSTSAITTKKIYFDGEDDIGFSIDVCIIAENNDGTWDRLIHEKSRDSSGSHKNDRYYWNTAPNSKKYSTKLNRIRRNDGWPLIQNDYIKVKNSHLRNREQIPSFVCFIESINNVYNQMFNQ